MKPISILILIVLLLSQLDLNAQHLKINPPAHAANRIDKAAVKSSLQQIPLSLEIPAGGNAAQSNTLVVREPMPLFTTSEALAIKAEKLLHKKHQCKSSCCDQH